MTWPPHRNGRSRLWTRRQQRGTRRDEGGGHHCGNEGGVSAGRWKRGERCQRRQKSGGHTDPWDRLFEIGCRRGGGRQRDDTSRGCAGQRWGERRGVNLPTVHQMECVATSATVSVRRGSVDAAVQVGPLWRVIACAGQSCSRARHAMSAGVSGQVEERGSWSAGARSCDDCALSDLAARLGFAAAGPPEEGQKRGGSRGHEETPVGRGGRAREKATNQLDRRGRALGRTPPPANPILWYGQLVPAGPVRPP